MGNRAPGNTNTGGGVKGKKVRTTSDDAGGKCVSENSSWKRSSKRGHTHTHTHTTYSLTVTNAPIHIHTFSCVSHTNTLEYQVVTPTNLTYTD